MYGGGSYPGYSSTAGSAIGGGGGGGGGGGLSSSVGPYPSEAPGGYWGHVGGHGADIPPFLGSGGNNYAFGSTPAVIGSSIPPYTPSAIPGGLPPIGGGSPLGPPLGIPNVPGYYGGGGVGGGGIGGGGGGIGGIGGIGGGGIGGIGGGGIDGNRPFNIKCDDADGFKQVLTTTACS